MTRSRPPSSPGRPGRRTVLTAGILGITGLAGTACSGDGGGGGPVVASPPSPSDGPSSGSGSGLATAVPDVRIQRTVVSGLATPWGLAPLPSGEALVAERDSGRVLRVSGAGRIGELGTVPGVRHGGEGGLLGLAVAQSRPDTLFAYFTSDAGDNRVVSIPVGSGRLGDPVPLLTGIPSGGIHNGGRLAIGPDGHLWIGTGESGNRPLAQDRASLGGKILRIALDGTVPADNPFPGSPVWSYGHRNVQGLAFDSSGQLWNAELGQDTWDELNRVTRGGNHGWPVVEGIGHRAGFVDPQVVFPTDDCSPSGLAIVDDVAYLAALRGTRLYQVPIRGGRAGTPKAWFEGDLGRLRTVVAMPNGKLWLTTSNRDGRGQPGPDDDRILELTLT